MAIAGGSCGRETVVAAALGWRRRSGRRVVEALGAFADNAASDEALERAERAVVLGGDEADRVADRVGAAGAADAVDVILGVHREIVIDDMGDAVHVDAARGDVGGDQDAHRAGLEILERAEPLVLRAVGVDGGGLDAVLFEPARDPVGAMLGAGEDEHRVERGFAQQMGEQRGLEMLGNFVDELRHGLGGVGAAADLDGLRGAQEFAGERLDFLGERGGEEERLALLAAAL